MRPNSKIFFIAEGKEYVYIFMQNQTPNQTLQ